MEIFHLRYHYRFRISNGIVSDERVLHAKRLAATTLPPWRPLLVTTARLLKETYGRTLIMPMTIWRRDYFDEVMTGLRQFEPELFHFCLTATEEIVRQRLHRRESAPQALAWTLQRVERCVTAFASPAFAVHLATDDQTPEEIVTAVLTRIGH